MKDVVVVWRAADGGAVQTYANADRSPRVFSDTSAPELAGASTVTKDELTSLLETHAPFEPRRVDTRTVTSLLGWDV